MERDYYHKIINYAVMRGYSRGQCYNYAKFICLRFRYGDDYPERIEIFKAPMDIDVYHFPFNVPLQLYFSKYDEKKVVHLEYDKNFDNDGNYLGDLPF